MLLVLPFLSCAAVKVSDAERFATPPRRLALASPEPRQTVTVDGVSLAFHDSAPGSNAPVLLCLHAIGHGGSDFAGVVKTLSPQWRVITLDWPGHGASAADTIAASARRYTTLLEGFVRALELKRFVIVGNSIGGAVALQYAAAHSDDVRGLIVCNPGGLDPGGFIAKLFIGHLSSKFHKGAEGDASFAEWFEDYYGGILVTAAAKAQREKIVAAGWESAPILEQAWRSFATPEADIRKAAASLPMPVLVAWAARDELIQWNRNEDGVRAIPHATVVQFEAGHSAFLETPDAFFAAATPFLAGLAP